LNFIHDFSSPKCPHWLWGPPIGNTLCSPPSIAKFKNEIPDVITRFNVPLSLHFLLSSFHLAEVKSGARPKWAGGCLDATMPLIRNLQTHFVHTTVADFLRGVPLTRNRHQNRPMASALEFRKVRKEHSLR